MCILHTRLRIRYSIALCKFFFKKGQKTALNLDFRDLSMAASSQSRKKFAADRSSGLEISEKEKN